MDIITDISWRNKDLNMKTSSSPCLNDIMATGNDSGHSDQWSPNSSMALGHHYGHRRWLRPWATIWSSVTTKVMSINPDSGCDRTTGPDMVLISSKGLDVTMDPVGSAGRPLRWQCSPWTPIWLQVVNQIPGIDMAWLYQGSWTSTQILAVVGSIPHNTPVYMFVYFSDRNIYNYLLGKLYMGKKALLMTVF